MTFNFGDLFSTLLDILYNLANYFYKFLTLPLDVFASSIPFIEKIYDVPLLGSVIKGLVNLFGTLFPFPILSVEGAITFVGIGLLFVIIKHFI